MATEVRLAGAASVGAARRSGEDIKMKRVKGMRWSGAALTLLLGACSLAPPLKTPVVPTADAYKELGPWTQAQPADRLPRDSWWTLYDNAELDELREKADRREPDPRRRTGQLRAGEGARPIRRAPGCFPRWVSAPASSAIANRSTRRSWDPPRRPTTTTTRSAAASATSSTCGGRFATRSPRARPTPPHPPRISRMRACR